MAKVGKISIDLVLSTARFTSELAKGSKSTNKFVKGASKELKQLRKDFNLAAKQAALIGTAAVAGFAVVAKASLSAQDALQATADKLDINVTKLAELGAAGVASDVKITTLTMALQRMTRRVSEAAQGTGEAQGALKELGISAENLNALSPDEQFKKIAEEMAKIPSQSDKVRLSFKLFDSEGVDLLRTLDLGIEGMNKLAQEARDMGFALEAVDAKKLEDANAAIDRAGVAITGLGNLTTAAIAPMLTTLATGFADAAKEHKGFRAEIQGTVELVIFGAGTMAKVFTGFFGAMQIGWHTLAGTMATFTASQNKGILNLVVNGATAYEMFFGTIEEGWLNVVGFANAAAAASLQSLGSLIISSLGLVSSISPELAAALKADLAPALHDLNVAAQEMGKDSVKAFEDSDAAAAASAEKIKFLGNAFPSLSDQVQLYGFAAKEHFAAADEAGGKTILTLDSIERGMVKAMTSLASNVNTATGALKDLGDQADTTGGQLTAAQQAAADKIAGINEAAATKLRKLTFDSTDFAIDEAERARDAMIAAKGDTVLAEDLMWAEIEDIAKKANEAIEADIKARNQRVIDSVTSATQDIAAAWMDIDGSIAASHEERVEATQKASEKAQLSEDKANIAFMEAVEERNQAVADGASQETIDRLNATVAMRESEHGAAVEHNEEAKEMAAETAGLNAAWEAAGQAAANAASTNFSKAADLVIEKTVASAASALGMGGGSAAGWGEAEGGIAGSIGEVAAYLVTAGTAYLAAKAIAKKADGGFINAMGLTGFVNVGSGGPRDDNILIRPNTAVSNDEFVTDARSTAANRSILDWMHAHPGQSISKLADGGEIESGDITAINPGISQEQKAVRLADNMVIGSGIAFVTEWLKAGDQYTGIPAGILGAIEHMAISIGGGLAGKLVADVALADGGSIPTSRGAEQLKAFPQAYKTAINAGGCAGCSSDSAGCGETCGITPSNELIQMNKFLDKRFNLKGFAHGGSIGALPFEPPTDPSERRGADLWIEHGVPTEDGDGYGILGDAYDAVTNCAKYLAEPGKVIEQLWEGIKDHVRAPVVPIARHLVSDDVFPSINKDALTGVFESAFATLDTRDLLGDCAGLIPGLANGGPIPAYQHGGFQPSVPGGQLSLLGEGSKGDLVLNAEKGANGAIQLVAKGGPNAGGPTTNINVTVNVDNFIGNQRAIRELAREVGAEISKQSKRVFRRN